MITTVYSLEFAPLVPEIVIVLLAILSLLLIVPLIFQRARGGLIRLGLAALACVLLSNPVLQKEKRESETDVALILVDKSPSQRIGEREDVSAEVLEQLTAELNSKPDLEYQIVRTDGKSPTQDGTHLLPSLIRAQASISPDRLAGTFILSDGQVQDRALTSAIEEDFSDVLHVNSPIHLLQTTAADEQDRRIVVEEAPRFSIIGEEAPITFSIDDTLHDSKSPETNVNVIVDSRPYGIYRMKKGEPLTINPVIKHGGQTLVEIQVPEMAGGELTTQNNRTIVAVNGIRQRLKVLLITGEPHMGERTWRNLLKSDPSVELVHFTILRPPEKQDGTPSVELALIAFPTRELFVEKLDEFDLIIFDRYKLRGVLPLNYFQNIARYVQDGGALLVAAGPAFSSSLSVYRTPLGRILPGRPSGTVLTESFRPALTDKGQIHPVTATLPKAASQDWGRWFRMVDTELLSGKILMDGLNKAPLLIVSNVGEGRVAQLNSDQAWLWTRGFEGGGPQTELLRRTAHWLMKEPELEEEALHIEVRNDTLHATLTTMQPRPADLIVTKPDNSGETLSLIPVGDTAPGKWTASTKADQIGIYRAAFGPIIAATSNGSANPIEFANMLPTAEKLQPLLDATGGGTFKPASRDGITLPTLRQYSGNNNVMSGPDWAGIKRNNAYRVTGYTQAPLVPAFAALLLLVGGLLFGWYRESR